MGSKSDIFVDRISKKIQNLSPAFQGYSDIVGNVAQKNKILNNAKKQLYLHLLSQNPEYSRNNKTISFKKTPEQIQVIVKEISTNSKRQLEVFTQLQQSTAETIKLNSQLDKTSGNEGGWYSITDFVQEIDPSLVQFEEYVAKLILIYQSESNLNTYEKLMNNNAFLTLFNEERQIYKYIGKNIAPKLYEAFSTLPNRLKEELKLSSSSVKLLTIYASLGIILLISAMVAINMLPDLQSIIRGIFLSLVPLSYGIIHRATLQEKELELANIKLFDGTWIFGKLNDNVGKIQSSWKNVGTFDDPDPKETLV